MTEPVVVHRFGQITPFRGEFETEKFSYAALYAPIAQILGIRVTVCYRSGHACVHPRGRSCAAVTLSSRGVSGSSSRVRNTTSRVASAHISP